MKLPGSNGGQRRLFPEILSLCSAGRGRAWPFLLRPILLTSLLTVALLASFSSMTSAAEDPLPPGDQTPVLRLEAGGPSSNVNSLGFSPDGQYLYAAGWDKLVQVWNRNDAGNYEYNSAAGLRVPTGSGNFGGLNAMSVSDDGRWLAVAGLGHSRDLSGERRTGWIVPAGMRTEAALLDTGMIYVFNLETRETTLVRGHRGPVQALAFVRKPGGAAPNLASVPPELVSIAEEPLEDNLTKPEIRFWNVQQKTSLATLTTFPSLDGNQQLVIPGLQGFRPGLVAWSTGANPNQVQVALAWGDNQFRLWDVQSGQIAFGAGGDILLTVLPLSDDYRRMLTGAHGYVGVWSLPAQFAAGLLKPNAFQQAAVPEVNGKQFHLPRAAAFIRGAAGDPDSIAMIVTEHLTDDEGREIGRAKYRLLILDAKAPVKTLRAIDLWEGSIRQPSLAVTWDGLTLAVAGHPQNEIRIFKVNDLIKGEPPKPQVISSFGLLFRDAVFVRDGDRWGIKLSQAKRDQAGKFPADALVLDIAARRVAKATDQWRTAEADATGWSSNLAPNQAFTVGRPGKPPLVLKLEQDYQPLATAFCPASKVCPIPLVAVASHLRGQPLLQIFDGDSGSPLRWCEGHTERIRSLGFSEDGRMLLSVADDRTVAVWTVTDLVDRVLKKRGRIPDLVVRLSQDQLVVSTPGSSSFQKGDVVLTLRSNGRTATPATAKEFYRFVLDCVPTEQLEITVRRNGAEQVVMCLVEQAIDEAKPLFSLFVAPSERQNEWEWIGWHPLGNFDFRGDRVERHVGWHFNTGNPQSPASFATVHEYRDKFVLPDLLQSLIAKQKLELANVPPANPEIKLSLRYQADNLLEEELQTERMVIRSRDVSLVAEVAGIADRRIRSVTVSVDSAAPIALTAQPNREWVADLSGIKWDRGAHQLSVAITSPDGEIVRSQSIQFQPRPPVIQWEQSWDKPVATGTVNVVASVSAANEPIHVELKIYPPEKGAQRVKEWDFPANTKPLQIATEVNLESGESLLRLEAWNIAGDRPDEKLEPVHKIIPVTRAKLPQSAKITELTVSEKRADAKIPLVPTDEYVYHTGSPVVSVSGLVQSTVNLDSVELLVGKKRQELSGFQPGKQTKYSLNQQVTLQPGQREVITIRATAGNLVDVRRLELEYVPALPSVVALKVEPRGVLRALPPHVQRESLVYFADYDDNRVTVKATLEGNVDQNCTGTFLLNDQASEPIAIRPGQIELTANLELPDGTSFVELLVKGPGASLKSPPVKVTFRRPPVLSKPEAAAQILDGQVFNLLCDAKSKIPLRSAFFTVGDERKKLRFLRDQDHPDQWLLSYTGQLALPNGDHRLRISATNDDGDAIEPVSHDVRIGLTSSPPVLQVLNPAATVSVEPVVEVEFRVKSTSPAEVNIDVRCDNERVDQLKPLAEHPGDDRPMTVPIQLAEGVNTVTLTAYSKEGRSEKQVFQISYVAPPVVIDIVKIDGQTPDFKVKWTDNEKHCHVRERMLKNAIPLQGQVIAKESLSNKSPLYAQVWVNSFKLPTVPVVIDPKNPKKAIFATTASLSHKDQNLIQVKIIGKEGPQPTELGKTGALFVDCDTPVRNQTLYLLMLGTGNAKQQEDQARKSLEVNKTIQPGVWRSDHFSEIYVLNAMNDNVPYVQGKLAVLQRKMESKLKAYPDSGGNSIVMVLFQGQVQMEPDQLRLHVDTLPSNRVAQLNEMLSGKLLESQLNKSYGAHLLLLDLQQQAISRDAIWSKTPHLGLLITNWSSLANRPAESRLIADLRAQYPKLSEFVASVEQRSSTFPGQLEIVDRLQNHYALQFGADK